MNILELSEQEIIRRESLNELRNMGIEPYPAAEYPTNAFSTDILAEFKDEDEPRQVCIAGRMMSRRVMGKASFIELQDSKGRVQVYITRDDICPGENKDTYKIQGRRCIRQIRGPRAPLPSALRRPRSQRRRKRDIHQAQQDIQFNARILQHTRLHGG